MTVATPHRWHFFRAGGFDQVQINSPEDLLNLSRLDQKLWASLACPVSNLALDRRMLEYIDHNGDGRIRAPEVLAAVDWALARLADPAVLFTEQALPLSALRDDEQGVRLKLAAKRLLNVLGRPNAQSVSCADTEDLALLFPPEAANGDGVVPASMTQDAALKRAIEVILLCQGGLPDRSAEQGVGLEQIEAFFEQVNALQSWHQSAQTQGLDAFAEHTETAVEALTAVRDKVDDYFTRVALAAFDPRAVEAMNAPLEELARIGAGSLADVESVAALPLAAIGQQAALPLLSGLNPAWAEAIERLRLEVVKPLLGELTHLSATQWQAIVAQCAQYLEWQAAKPVNEVSAQLELEEILQLAASPVEQQLRDLIEADLAVAPAADGLVELDKLIRLQKGLLVLLRNFVSFQDFYARQEKAVFQAGSLFIDGKTCELVTEVSDIEAHAKVAAASESFLLYLTCTRRGEPVHGREQVNIVAAVTAGTEGDLQVGRHGLFYDREGNDWDAQVVKVVQNAISIREAFWSPYRRISGMVTEQIQKLAASRDAEMVNGAAQKVAEVPAAPAAPAFDIAKFAGIFAAFGLAVGALGTALAAMVTGVLALAWWQIPLLFFGCALAISGPSMLMAWFKLRRRSLGPILDANGWAVNSSARLSIGFGAALTQLASLPSGAERSLRDPYARTQPLWPWLTALGVLVVVVLALWLTGDIQSVSDLWKPSNR